MTKAAQRAAAGFAIVLGALPDCEFASTPDTQEAARRTWGICLGAVAEGLELAGEMRHAERIEFYRLAGLEVFD